MLGIYRKSRNALAFGIYFYCAAKNNSLKHICFSRRPLPVLAYVCQTKKNDDTIASMNYLSVENLSKSFGEKVLFNNLGFGIGKGDKTAFIAINGAGKTTLMRMLTGKEEPDGGSITFAEGIRVGYLEQEPDFPKKLTIDELIKSEHNEVQQCVKLYERLTSQSAENHDDPSLSKQLAEVTTRMEALHAWNYDRRLVEMLTRFGITNLNQTIGSLSGGQVKRLSLAMLLVDQPDLLLLDEPTNHLDIPMIEWLEKYLKQSNITLLMVTHDRYFLDRVCNNILELFLGKLYLHKGNFSYYVQKSTEREAAIAVEIQKAGQLLKSETEWMRRMPQARTTKSKSRIAAYYELKEKAAQRRTQQQIQLDVSAQRIGSKVLEMRNIHKSFGNVPILNGFDYTFTKGERIGVVGDNGVGKTTFLNLITGDLLPDKGRVISGDTIVFGYYTQAGIRFDESKRVIDVVKEIAEIIPSGSGNTATASQWLSRFMFPPVMQNQPVYLLSGGEKRRLYLLTVLIKNPNFLILDEPTNDLDLITLQAMEDFISEYKGCLLIVSHDRYFMDQVVDQLFVFDGDGEVRGFTGNYSDYREFAENKIREEKAIALPSEKNQNQQKIEGSSARKIKRTYKEQKEYEQIESDISTLEHQKSELTAQLQGSETDYQRLAEISEQIGEIDQELERRMERWLELDEIEK